MYVDDGPSGSIGKPPDNDQVLKRCTKCGVDKPLSAYGKRKGGSYGLHPLCKECQQPLDRARYEAKRDELLAAEQDDTSKVKRCTNCGVDKPLSAYGKQPGGRLGLHPRCKECRQAQERARYAEKREEILAKQKANPNRKANRLRHERRKKYGVTDDLLGVLTDHQDGRCAVCGGAVEKLCIDHDHDTGVVRGLLCSPCNIGLGHLKDDPVRLLAAVEYLRDPPARRLAKILDLAAES
jgi:hypothetical protein